MLRFLSLIIMSIYLITDFKKTKGYYKAKVFHGIILTYIVYYYSTAFAYLGSLLRRGEEQISQYNVSVGFLPAELNLFVWASQLIISCFFIHCAWGLTLRKEKSRQLLIKVLPFALAFETCGFYRGFTEGGDEGLPHYFIFLLGFIIMGLINGTIFFIYKSRFMKEFFNAEKSMILEKVS